MSFWTAVVLLFAIIMISEMYRTYAKQKHHASKLLNQSEVMERLDKMEKRMANLETIVLDRDKERRFEEIKTE